ncbi:MAG: efflux RND transporter permease subunit [Desulfosalsimonas sp.]
MKNDPPLIDRFFDHVVLARPVLVLVCILMAVAVLARYAVDLKIEASADTLVQQDNADYLYYQEIIERFGYDDFLVIAYTPESGNLLSEQVLSRIGELRDEIAAMERISSVVTILDVPLLESPPMPVAELVKNVRTLSSPDVDRSLARKELKTSPLYQDLLVSSDLETTALQINFKSDPAYEKVWQQRQQLREKAGQEGLSGTEKKEMQRLQSLIDEHWSRIEGQRSRDIAAIRTIMENYENDANLFLGGVSMVANDLMRFIQKDLKVYGGGVVLCMVLVLWLIFRRMRWVVLPLVSCGLSAVATMGLMGLFGWKVTVVSSNFIALQLIITMAISIHLVVRYRELIIAAPHKSHAQLTAETVKAMKTPCIYAGLTTIAGFGSLLFAGIKPVQTFGWMMSAGIVVSLAVTFIFFPAALVLFKKIPPPSGGRSRIALTRWLAGFTRHHGRMIVVLSLAALVLSAAGIGRLRVENAFIDYFKSSTEIHQGMTVIDRKLGGTTPLDVIIDFKAGSGQAAGEPADDTGSGSDGFDEFSDFDEFDEQEDSDKYWFTPHRLDRIETLHDYLDGLDHTGKVLSLATLTKVAERLTGGPLDTFDAALLFNEFPEQYRQMLVAPYASVEHNQARISLRVIDSDPQLRRNALLEKIGHDVEEDLGFAKDSVKLTGMLVLYNDVLQSLFGSQIMTLGLVVLALMIMFLILFQSFTIALIAIFPNLLATGVVLGTLGWAGIPLDIMTITIASISVGIAVDDTIHYIHRFEREFQKDGDYLQAMQRCHGSIGYAMYYTTIIIIIGFSILATSNFIPTVIFGVFTGLAMFIALVAALTLLPQLIIWLRPFGPAGRVQSANPDRAG